MAFSISSSSGFQEEVIEREIVPDGVSPSLPSVAEIRKIVKDILVDVSQHQLLLGAAEDGHGDQADIGVLGFGLFREGDAKQARIQLCHGEHG